MGRGPGSGVPCWRHPGQGLVGVCARCLQERLSSVAESQSLAGIGLGRFSEDGYGTNHAEATDMAMGEMGAGLGLGISPLLSEAFLRRSKSWSHWEGPAATSRGGARHWSNGFARKSDAVLDEWTRQRFFSIFARESGDPGARKEAFGHGSGSARLSHHQKQAQKLHAEPTQACATAAAFPAPITVRIETSDVGFLGRKSKEKENLHRPYGNFSMHHPIQTKTENESLESPDLEQNKKKRNKGSSWWSSLLHLHFIRHRSSVEDVSNLEAKKAKRSTGIIGFLRFRKGEGSQPRKQGRFEVEGSKQIKKGEIRAYFDSPDEDLGGIHEIGTPNLQRHGFGKNQQSMWRTISTPLRIFSSKNGRKRTAAEENSWSIPSSGELRRPHNHPTPAQPSSYTTAYYRDYTWSATSSPMPSYYSRGGRWNQRFNRPPSPYHANSSTGWSFFLTPLRPVKGSARHRH